MDNAYHLCYGLSGCPTLVSKAYHSDLQMLFLSHVDEYYGIELVDELSNMHGGKAVGR